MMGKERRASSSVRNDIVNSGIVPSDEKCNWYPTQNGRWLGYYWDLKHQLSSIPNGKMVRLLATIPEARPTLTK